MQVTCIGKPIRVTTDLPMENLKAKRAWDTIFQIPKYHNYQITITHPAWHKQAKTILDNKPNQKKIQKAVFQTEENKEHSQEAIVRNMKL